MTDLEKDLLKENEELRKALYQIEAEFSQIEKMFNLNFRVAKDKLWSAIQEALKIIRKKATHGNE